MPHVAWTKKGLFRIFIEPFVSLYFLSGKRFATTRCKKYDISANKCCHDGWVRNFFGPISALYLKRSKEYAAHSTEHFADFKVRCKGAFIVLLAHKICQFYGPKWPILFMARWPVYKHSIFYNYHTVHRQRSKQVQFSGCSCSYTYTFSFKDQVYWIVGAMQTKHKESGNGESGIKSWQSVSLKTMAMCFWLVLHSLIQVPWKSYCG